MATVTNNTVIGAPSSTGGLRVGDTSVALPTGTKAAIDPALKFVGLVSEDGLEESPERSTDDIRAWGGDIARTVQSEYGLKVTFTLISRTEVTLKEVFGQDNVITTVDSDDPGTSLRTIVKNEKQLPFRAWVADIMDGDRRLRLVYPNAQITEIGSTQFVHSDLIKYELTLTCYKDSSGNNGYEYESVMTA